MKTYRRTLIALVTLTAICLISNSALAQDSLYIDPSGNVGIGTTNPGSKLEIKTTVAPQDALNILASSGPSKLTIRNGGFNDVWMSLYDHTGERTFEVDAVGRMWYTGGNVGIGLTNPAYTLDIIGDIHYTGKLSGGGIDPPYVLYDYETRQSVVDRVVKEIPPDKLDGAVLFFNGETSKMEILLPKKGEFRSLPGQLLESISPITKTFEVEDKYYFDRKTGKVNKYKVRKVPTEKFKIKKDHVLDSKTGKFYRVTRDKNGDEEEKIEVTKEQAVEPADLSVKDS